MSLMHQAEQTVGRCQSSAESERSSSSRCPCSSRNRCETRRGDGPRMAETSRSLLRRTEPHPHEQIVEGIPTRRHLGQAAGGMRILEFGKQAAELAAMELE